MNEAKLNSMKKIIIGILTLMLFTSIEGQQDAMFTHYAFNTLAVNPAYAGTRDALTVTTLHRSQWVGFEGAPNTQTLTLHTPIHNDKLGMGLSIMNDKIGPINTMSLYGDFAYKIKINEKGKLALGLKGGINLMQGELNTLNLDEQNDASFTNNIESKILPNFGFGAYYYTAKWYVGLSTPKLLENNFSTNTVTGSSGLSGEQRHFYVIGGTVLSISQNLKFKPSTFIKVTKAAPIEADLTGMFIYKDLFEAGVMLRTGDAVGALFGYNINNQFRVGYSYDWSFTNKTFKYNGGSHELMIRYDFIYKDKARIRSPRYF